MSWRKENFMLPRWKMPALATALAVLFLTSPAIAQEGVKIGYIDLQKALNASSSGKAAVEQLRGIFEEKKISLEREKASIEQRKDELDKQALLMNEATRREREDDIRRLERDWTRKINDSKDEMGQQEGRFLDQIRVELLKVIEDMGREGGYTLILEKSASAVMYAPGSIDLTEEVVKRYDAWKSQ
jgi:outer membrane protein